MTICGISILSEIVDGGVDWIKIVFGGTASWILGATLIVIYLALMRHKAAHPVLPHDETSKSFVKASDLFATARTGLHFMLPGIALIRFLMGMAGPLGARSGHFSCSSTETLSIC